VSDVGYSDGTSRIIQGLAQANLGTSRPVGLVRPESEKPHAYASPGRAIPPYSEPARSDDLIAEEKRLIERAISEGFFWNGDQVESVILSAVRISGGSEHDVYVVGKPPFTLIIRSTIEDSYGFRGRSPVQYLKRLEDYNRVFPGLQIRMIGASHNSRGNGVLWTAQTFVEGREFREEKKLEQEMARRGWERIDSAFDQQIRYRHLSSGVIIRDAHGGNVLLSRGQLFPIDVIIDDVGTIQ